MSARMVAVALALAVLAGCAQVPRKAYNREANGHIRSVAIVHVDAPERYEAIVLGHPGQSFGLIGGLIAAADMQIKSNRLTEALDPDRTRLRQRFIDKLASALGQQGYQVHPVAAPAGTPDDELVDVAKAKVAADATVTVTMIGRYMAAGATSDYFPQIVVKVRKMETGSRSMLYEDTFSYGFTLPQSQTVHFASDASYRFADIDRLLADPSRTRDGLLAGLDAIVAQIAADLRRP